MALNEAMRRRRRRGLEPFAHYIGLRDLPAARFLLDVRHQSSSTQAIAAEIPAEV
jgi:hypothetical protein